jgi:serine/threonine-protein kinase RIO1
MLWMKRLELVSGKKYFLSDLANKNDHIFNKLHNDIRNVISYFNKHTFIAFTQWIAAGILSWLRNLYIKLFHIARKYPHSKKVIDMVQGKGEVNVNGGASFFLKKISDDSDANSTTTSS